MYRSSGINALGQRLMYRGSSDRSSVSITMDSYDDKGYHMIPIDSVDSYDYNGFIRFL